MSSASNQDKYFFAAFLVALGILLLIAGSLLTVAGIPPGPQITRAYEGGRAYYEKLFFYDDVYRSDLWNSARTDNRGVTVYNPERTQAGATLYTSGHKAAAYLISMEGDVLHSWELPFSKIWDESAAVQQPQPDSHVYMRKAELDSDGNLFAIYEGAGDTPYGYGLVKLDKNSNVIWRYLQSAHHDFDIAPDGRIFVLTHEIADDFLPQLNHLEVPRLDDFLVILSPEGEELNKIPLLAAVDNSDYRQLLFDVSSFSLADPLHTNSVHLITEQEARVFAFGEAGQILVSFRELNAVGVIDLEEEKLVWAENGYWRGQHDPRILANGNLLLFDNIGNFRKPEGRSRVLEFNPETLAIVWQYQGTPDTPLESNIRSYSQRLDNGNTLITESGGGRLLEVTPDQELVWEYINPIRGGPDNDMVPIVCKAIRLDQEQTAALLAVLSSERVATTYEQH